VPHNNFDLFNNELPTTVKRTVEPELAVLGGSRVANDVARGRKYLSRDEVMALVKAAKKNRHGSRDSLMIRLAYEHGLRVSELVNTRWQHLDLSGHTFSVSRAKGSVDSTHPLQGDTVRAIKKFQRELSQSSGLMFTNERGAPVSVDGFRRMFGRLSQKVLGTVWNPHALRHACGVHLVNSGTGIRQIQQYMGHSNIQNTVVYTTLSAAAFNHIQM
jgi:type 1 fimbriae regulatory protein FimB/type 1 fimbriae regulatory protein FimE